MADRRRLLRRSRQLAAILPAVALLFAAPLATAAERVALVIGNGAYAHASPSPQTVANAGAVAEMLRRAGFDTIEGLDLTREAMTDAVLEFGTRATDADVALVFYSGHAMQAGGETLLLPVDARFDSPASVHFEGIRLGAILATIALAGPPAVILLDAAIESPFAERVSRTIKMADVRRLGIAPGPGEALPSMSGAGQAILFAEAPGRITFDGPGPFSPFTTAVLAHLAAPGEEFTIVASRITGAVLTATDGRQRPWLTSSLMRPVFLVPADAATPGPSSPSAPGDRTDAAPETTHAAPERRRGQDADAAAFMSGVLGGIIGGAMRD